MTITNMVTVRVICDGKNCSNIAFCRLNEDLDDLYFLQPKEIVQKLIYDHKWVVDLAINKHYCPKCGQKFMKI